MNQPAQAEQSTRLRLRPAALLALATVLVLALTIAVYLARAGAAPSDNWPTNLNLMSSDNGILYEVARDIMHGVRLDWSFSPQVYVFPEIPISLLAYVIVGGSLQGYFIAVAALNIGLLFLALVAVSAALWPGRPAESIWRALGAVSPLLLLPLVAEQKTYFFQLFPTYYFGMMLFGFVIVLALVAPRRWMRIAVLAAWALAGAANPLVFAMTLPGMASVALLLLLRRDRRTSGLLRALAWVVGALACAIVVRLVWFNPIAGTDPASYISFELAERRMREINGTFRDGFHLGFDPLLLWLSWGALALCLVLSGRLVWAAARARSLREPAGHATLVRLYLALLPFLGAVALAVILALHVYYLWFALVGSIVIVALLAPPPRLVRPLAIGLVLLLTAGAGWGISQGLYSNGRYFGYRSAMTECLDAVVPGQTGYSTFSDARPLSLPSNTALTLIAINADLTPNFWLTNRSYSKDRVGTFVLVNPETAQAPLDPSTIRAAWGAPAQRLQCGPAEVWTYPSAAQQQRLAAWFAQYADLR